MNDAIFELVGDYGVWIIGVSAFLSCLLVPIPTSLMMLTGGAFAASGEMSLGAAMLAAWVGAVLGDQSGYFLGRKGGPRLLAWIANTPSRRAVLGRAQALVDRRGPWGVFFSTWAVAPLGPWVNIAAGATGLSWRRFTLADVTGEMIWVGVYTGLGAIFAANIASIANIMSDVVGLLVALVVAVVMAFWIAAVIRNQKSERRRN